MLPDYEAPSYIAANNKPYETISPGPPFQVFLNHASTVPANPLGVNTPILQNEKTKNAGYIYYISKKF